MRESNGSADSAVVVQFATVEEIGEKMKSNPEMLKDYRELGEEGFVKKYLKPEEPVVDGDGAPVAPENESEKLKAELLERDNIIRELRDNRVTTLETTNSKLANENQELQAKLMAFKGKPVEEEPALPEELVVEDFTSEDLFDPEKGKKFIEQQKRIAEYAKSITEKLNSVANGVNEQVERLSAEEKRKLSAQAIEDERAEIDRIRRANPTLFNGKRELATIENEYIATMNSVAAAIGFKGEVLNRSTGQFAPEVAAAFAKMQTEKEGEGLRKSIKIPEDFDDLARVHEIRQIRNNNFERDNLGQIKPWSYTKSLETYISKQPQKEDPKLIEARKRKEAEARAMENRKAFATELPASGGASTVDLSAVNERDFTQKMQEYRKTNSPEAKSWLESVCRTAGWAQGEIDKLLSSNTKKG
jgi:hypothetical protein